MLLSPQRVVRDPYRVDVKRSGAKGDYNLGTGSGTDDRAAIITAIATARILGGTVYFPKGNYYISKYLDITGDIGLNIRADRGARLYFPSDDTGISIDATATSLAMARSGILLRYCKDTIIEGLTFVGGNSSKLNDNQGCGIYATGCLNTTIKNCNQYRGYALFVQDARTIISGTGDSLTVSSGQVTLVDAGATFLDGYLNRELTLANCSNPLNNGTFEITQVVNSTTIRFRNVDAVNETSSFTWQMDVSDYTTRIEGGISHKCHGPMRGGSNVEIHGHTFRLPDNQDLVGLGDYLTSVSGTVTLSDDNLKVTPALKGKYIKLAGATTGANNGIYPITAVTAATSANPASISFTNASGISEAYTGKWWIPNGEKVGLGAGVTALAKSGTTMTLTSSTAAFAPTDLYKNVRILEATTAANKGQYTITEVVSSTQIKFENSAGVAETYTGIWTVDGYDRVGASSDAYGSSHALYVFAGRSNYRIHHCTFENIRETAVKISGSALPINDITVDHCEFIDCGNVITWGADDSQQHNNLSFVDNLVIDCATGREGWHGGSALGILGSRDVVIARNKAYYSHNAVGAVDGRGVAANSFISVSRYQAGRSQPVEGIEFIDNIVTCNPNETDGSNGNIVNTCALFSSVGLRAHYRTGGTLTKHITANLTMSVVASTGTISRTTGSFITDGFAVGGSIVLAGFTNAGNNSTKIIATLSALSLTVTDNTGLVDETGNGNETGSTGRMTLTDSSMIATKQLIGRTLDLINSASSNDGQYVIDTVPSSTSITYINTAGTGGSASAGTYRIWTGKKASTYGNALHAGGSLKILRNSFDNIAPVIIGCVGNVGPEVAHNTLNVGSIQFIGDVCPRVYGNRQISTNTTSATLRFDSGTSWPIAYDNTNVNANGLNTNLGARSWVIGVDNGTARDYPLLGKSGRVRPSNALEEVVVAYGYNHVDGDTIEVSGATYTYKASGPTGNQFNSFAGLVALIDAQANHDCADYGTGFTAGSVTTQHMRIRRTVKSTSDAGTLYVRVIALNPTALVMLRNKSTSTPFSYGHGSGSAGPVEDKTVVWSPCALWETPVQLIPDNATARTMLFDGSPAEGKITCVAKASLADGDYLTIGDGITPAKSYEFDLVPDGVVGGRIVVDVSTDTTAAQVAARLKTAIETNQPLFTVTDNADGTLTLYHKIPGVVGNVTITENVANAGFLVVGMVNGLAGGYIKVGNQEDTGACAIMQHAKSANQAGTDLGAEFRFHM